MKKKAVGSAAKVKMTGGLYVWIVSVFFASELLARHLGVRFTDYPLGTLYQYLDPEILRHDLARGLFYLHGQPPLFNLFLGLVLKLFPEAFRGIFALCYFAVGGGLVLGTAWLMARLGVPRAVNAVLCLLLVLSPTFIVYSHWLFYTLPVAALVLAGAGLLTWYVDSGRPAVAHLFSWCAALLMLTRAVYHPIWFVAVLAAVVPLVARQRRRTLLVSALAPLLLVNFWYLKNYVQVGTYSGSSWLGMSLAKRWPLSQKEMAGLRAEGNLPPTWHRRPFREPAELRAYGFFKRGEDIHPAVDEPYKSNGEPNFNHRDYARISREILRGDLYLIRHYQDRYIRRTITSFLLFLQPGPNSVHFLVDYDFAKVHRLRDTLTRLLFLGGPIARPIRMLEPPPNLWLVGFPALVLFGCFRALRRSLGESLEMRPVFAYMVVTIIWVTLSTNLIEIGENDRMRWEVEPLLVVLLGCALARLGLALRRWRQCRGGFED